MTKEERIVELRRMLRNCPEMLTPNKVSKWTLIGKNKVYELIKTRELKSFVYRGGYMIAKDDLIEYLADSSEQPGSRNFHIKSGGQP